MSFNWEDVDQGDWSRDVDYYGFWSKRDQDRLLELTDEVLNRFLEGDGQ